MNGYTKALLAGAINWRGHILAGTSGEPRILIPRVTIISHDRASAEWLLTVGGESEWKQDRNGKRWLWRCQDDEAMDILKATRPWLRSHQKRVQADLLIKMNLGPNGERLFDARILDRD
jgi:hypothetical protein